MSRNREGMPTVLCQAPQCFRPSSGYAVEEGLGVTHCDRHAEWAKARVAEIVKEQASKVEAGKGATNG